MFATVLWTSIGAPQNRNHIHTTVVMLQKMSHCSLCEILAYGNIILVAGYYVSVGTVCGFQPHIFTPSERPSTYLMVSQKNRDHISMYLYIVCI